MNWYQESNFFDSDQKLVLELADAITATPAKVTPELRERLQKRFSTPELVELGAAIAWENYRARANRVFGFGSEGFYHPATEKTPASKAPAPTASVSPR
jgi:alkylhydroperoxidase family enzyme